MRQSDFLCGRISRTHWIRERRWVEERAQLKDDSGIHDMASEQ